MNCLNVFDYFAELALKVLTIMKALKEHAWTEFSFYGASDTEKLKATYNLNVFSGK